MPSLPAAAVSDLVRFLLARVDEDDEEMRVLRRHQMRDTAPVQDLEGTRSIERQRAECEAKRAVIGHAQHLLVLRDLPAEKVVRDAATHVLRAMALPYREHYAFRAEWDPNAEVHRRAAARASS